jgi:hypothetical protein
LTPTLLPLITTSLDALMLILPLPSTEMSLPLITMVPSFFIVMLALPVLMVIDSPASTTQFLATVSESSLPTLVPRPPTTLQVSSPPIVVVAFLPTDVVWFPATVTERLAPTFVD